MPISLQANLSLFHMITTRIRHKSLDIEYNPDSEQIRANKMVQFGDFDSHKMEGKGHILHIGHS